MKKFVTVIVSFLVLFIFLTLNYLLWDKENLLKLRDNDKIEQDWLRGQNRTLQTSVDELEQSVEDLTDENNAQKDKIVDLEQQVRTAMQKESENTQTIQVQKEALNFYKSFQKENLKEISLQWFDDINNKKYEDSRLYMDKDFELWGKTYDAKQYIEFISAFQSIEIKKGQTEGAESFDILENQEDPYEISTRVFVDITIKKDRQADLAGIQNGSNTIEIVFRYDSKSADWAIKSISAIAVGKP